MALRLGIYGGIPVGVSADWLINALVVCVVGTSVAHGEVGFWPALGLAAGVVVGVSASLLVHEAGHAIAAHHHGIRIEAMVLSAFGAHVQLAHEPPSPRTEFLICAAGPFAGLAALMAVLVGIDVLGEPGTLGRLAHLELHAVTDVLLVNLLLVNVCSTALSVLPGLPLDGGGMLHALLWRRSGDRVGALALPTWLGVGIGLALTIGGGLAVLAHSPFYGALLLMTGLPIALSARRGFAARVKRGLLAARPLSDAFVPEPSLVPAAMDARAAMDEYFPVPSPPPYLPAVDAEGRYLGLVHRRELFLAIDTGPPLAVGHLVTPPERDELAAVAPPTAPLDAGVVLRTLARKGVAVAVDEGRRFHGVVTTASWQAALAEAARQRAA